MKLDLVLVFKACINAPAKLLREFSKLPTPNVAPLHGLSHLQQWLRAAQHWHNLRQLLRGLAPTLLKLIRPTPLLKSPGAQ